MKLTSFQILNCFGFINSGKIEFDNSNNFIFILGRNSSGKSSLMNSIKYLSKDINPSEQPNFDNFNVSEDSAKFIAEFSLRDAEIDIAKFKDDYKQYLATQGIDTNVMQRNSAFKEMVEEIAVIYEEAITGINAEKKCRVDRFGKTGNYYFGKVSETNSAFSRRDKVEEIIKSQSTNGQFNINGSFLRLEINFNVFENLIFNQFPIIYLFNEQFSLKEILPNKIKDNWETKGSNFEKRFIEYLGKEKVDRILETNNPKERREIEDYLNERIKLLIDKINENRATSERLDLLEILLDVSPEGIQITLYTDGKPSFYSHLSDNTKFLFAYHLYQTTADISGNILLFDEPNNGFHPTAQRMLLRFLQKLSHDGNLVIVSTHSEHLIDTDYLSSVRLMSADNDKNIIVKNHFYNQPKESGDYLALQPIYDAIGYRYGTQLGIKDKVIITEGVTDLLYLRTFNKILKISNNLDIAPARGDSTILQLTPFLISQGLNFKVVIDVGDVKEKIKTAFGIEDNFFYEIPIPASFPKMKGSGIEDLFSKSDFKKLLMERNHAFTAQFSRVSNSCYMNISDANKIEKRLLAEDLYKKADLLSGSDFEPETTDNFRKVLDFCENQDWFSL